MKKILIIALSLALVFALAACGGSGSGDGGEAGDSEWTRQGYFQDENENFLMILPGEDEFEGRWGVSLVIGDDMHGWYIDQEGETLHGDLTSEYEEGADPFVVTISEEGEDGVLVETEAGDQYHFTPTEVPEAIATIQVNTEGMGEITYSEDGAEPVFDDEYPYQSAVINVLEGHEHITIAARPSEGWKFVKWTKGGEDFSTEDRIDLEVSEDAEYIAVFEME